MTRRNLILIAALALSTVACGGSSPSSSTPLPTTAFTQTDIRVGTGAEAVNGRRLIVNYSLWLYDPAGVEQKGQLLQVGPAGGYPLTLGVGGVIRGWDIGVIGMRVGGLRRLIIPPDLAYGSSPPQGIPVNATLVFDIELLSVQ
jgi:FKBP-type peptidyl-prolyl cis-trans isomerase